MALVNFFYADIKPISICKKTNIKRFITQLFVYEGKRLKELNYIFCSDSYLLDINILFLKHNFLTDIISFDLTEKSDTIGEIYVSVERVRENASIHSATFNNELLRVIFHGALHLCGYKDKKKSEITLMRQKEDYYLQLFEEKL